MAFRQLSVGIHDQLTDIGSQAAIVGAGKPLDLLVELQREHNG